VVLGITCFIYVLVSADRSNLGIVLPAIKAEFHISNTEAGFLSTLLFATFTLSQIPSSLLYRRFKPRHLMSIALLLTATVSVLIGKSGSILDFKIYRALLGIIESWITLCCVTTINHWFSTTERGSATGLFWGGSKLGPVLFPLISVLVLESFGWRMVFQTFAIPVLIAASLWLLFVRGRPEDSKHVSTSELNLINATSAPSVRPRLDGNVAKEMPAWVDRLIRRRPVKLIDKPADVFRSWNIIGNAIAAMLLIGIFNVFLAWIPSYLLNEKHLPLSSVGIVSSVLFAGAVAGNLAGGWVSDRLLGLRRKPLMMLGALFTAIALVGLIYSPPSAILTGAFLLVSGFVVGVGYPHFTIYAMGLTTREVYPIAYGVTSTGTGLGAAMFPLIAGIILDASSWDTVFVALAAAALLCLGILTTLIEPAAWASSSEAARVQPPG
jgi:sugar phosphate permease